MKINEQTFPHIVKMLQDVTGAIAEIDEVCKIEQRCETCIFKVQEKGDWYYRCMQDEMVTIRNRLAMDEDYKRYLEEHNRKAVEQSNMNDKIPIK